MQLTGKQIISNGIISNHCEEGVQQQGVDVRIDSISEVYDYGIVPKVGKTTPCPTRQVKTIPANGGEMFVLSPGYYEITLMESCNIPDRYSLRYKTRSSLVRCGAIVHSGQFDAGFKTDAMGCFLEVLRPIRIEKGARIAQAIVYESYPVDEENLYNGQWQNDKQRTKKSTKKTGENG